MGKNQTLSSRQLLLLILLATMNMFNGFIFTLQAPFYPTEAVSKNSTATQYGIVFGLYDFTVFLFGPIFGATMPFLGSKLVFNIGVLIQGCTTVLFGFLDKLTNLNLFLSFSLLLRFFEGIGFAGSFVALLSFIPSQFPEHTSIVYGIVEMSNAIGSTLGPAVGGVLFHLGGFLLPFLVVGIIILVLEIILLPTTAGMSITDTRRMPIGEIINVLTKPSIAINLFVALMENTFLGFVFTNLEEYLKVSFSFTPLTIGLVFGMFGLCMAVLSPVWGYALGKLPSPYYLMLPASLLVLVGIIMIGPIQYLGEEPDMIITIIGILLFSISHGAVALSFLLNAMFEAKKHGYPEDGPTAALIPGCLMAACSLGAALGPVISGALYDAFGFRIAELWLTGGVIFLNIVLWANTFLHPSEKEPDHHISLQNKPADANRDENTPLLHTSA